MMLIMNFISDIHCVRSVQIRSYFWSVFSCIRTEYGDLLPYSFRLKENADKELTPYLDTFHAVIYIT